MKSRLAACVLLFLALVTALIVRVPLRAAPDESAHIDYVQYIAEHHALPLFKSTPPPGYGYEFHQPPLYYVLCAPGTLLPGDGVFYFCRAVSALCGLGILLLIWHAARLLFPQRDDIAIFAAGVAAVWPFHLGVSAAAGNDAFAGLWCAALFYIIARATSDGWMPRHAIYAGIFAGLGLWTKTTTLPVSLAALGALWQLAPRLHAASRGKISAPLAMMLTGFLVALPLFVRNQSLYGDPLGWATFSQAATAGTPGYAVFNEQGGVSLVQYVRGLLLILFCTAWGFFGGPDSAVYAIRPLAPSPKPLPLELLPLALICALATIGTALGAVRWRNHESLCSQAAVSAARWWSVGVLFIALGWAQFAYAHFSGAQARYLHPALLPLCVLGAAFWGALLSRRAFFAVTVVFGLTLFILTLLNISMWRTLV